MKNTARNLTAKLSLAGFFLAATILVNAQSNTNPSWMVSKGVQKVANKKNFENEAKSGRQLSATSLSQLWAISKGVNSSLDSEPLAKGNLPSTGVPSWTISKGVHQTKEANVPSQENVKPNENSSLIISKGVHHKR